MYGTSHASPIHILRKLCIANNEIKDDISAQKTVISEKTTKLQNLKEKVSKFVKKNLKTSKFYEFLKSLKIFPAKKFLKSFKNNIFFQF